MGLRPATGSVLLDGTDVSHASTRDRLSRARHIPEDRSEDGLVADLTVAENLILDVYDRPPYACGVSLNREAIRGLDGGRSQGLRHPRPVRADAGRRCPAATSRRSWSPAS